MSSFHTSCGWNIFSEGGPFQASAAMRTVPLSQAKEELMELMSRLRQLLLQVQEHLIPPQWFTNPRTKGLLEFWLVTLTKILENHKDSD